MKAVIYARQSSGKDDYSESVEAQIANCRKLAEKEKLEVIGIYRDLNSSGETYPVGAEEIARVDKTYVRWAASQSTKKNYRSGLGEVLEILPKVNFVLVNELTRLYRPINGSFLEGYINQLLKENDVKVLQVQGGAIDLMQFDQQLITLIKNQILYEDLQKKRQNSINAFRNKKDSGMLCTGTRAFGIKYLGNNKLEVKPECIEIIKFIYDSICDYQSYSSIIKACNDRWREQNIFYQSAIYAIAKQPLYAGYQYNSNGELIKNRQIAGQEFIPFEQWQMVQKIISTKRKSHYGHSKKHWLPLCGKIYCGECGSRLVCDVERGKIYYKCRKRNLALRFANCSNSRIRFETGVYGKSSLCDSIYPLLSIALLEKHRKAVDILKRKKELSDYQAEMENLNIKEQRLSNMYLEGLATEEQLRNMLATHKEKRRELAQKILMVKASDITPSKLQELEFHILSQLFSDLATKTLSHNMYESLLNEAEITLTVFRHHVDFHTKYGDVRIPRIQIKNRFWMPEWEIELTNSNHDKAMVIDENTQIKVTYQTGKEEVLADFGQLKILGK